MANETWRTHYLPQSYLRQFCGHDGRVLRTFRGPDDKLHERRFPPKATGYEPDLYSLVSASPLLPVQRQDLIETEVFRPIDHHGAVVLERLIGEPPSKLGDDERMHWARFLNSLLERHPQRIYERDRIAEQRARERIEVLRQQFGPPLPGRPDIFELVDVGGLARNIHREHMVREIQNERSVNYLKGLTLVKIAVEENPVLSFVAGDNPVLVNGGQPWPMHFFSVALTPYTLLVGFNSPEPPDLDTLLGLARIHNLQLFGQCEYIFSRDRLEDTPGIKVRTAAQLYLKRTSWKRS